VVLREEAEMSRTDKDLPFWMLSHYWEPDHHSCQYASWRNGRRECDLPAEPIYERPVNHSWRTRHGAACSWRPTWDHYYSPYGPRGVPDRFVRLYFTGPDRSRVRDELTKARQEYRATGEIDIVPSATQHRHMARWLYW
jgi:hypothetical protein